MSDQENLEEDLSVSGNIEITAPAVDYTNTQYALAIIEFEEVSEEEEEEEQTLEDAIKQMKDPTPSNNTDNNSNDSSNNTLYEDKSDYIIDCYETLNEGGDWTIEDILPGSNIDIPIPKTFRIVSRAVIITENINKDDNHPKIFSCYTINPRTVTIYPDHEAYKPVEEVFNEELDHMELVVTEPYTYYETAIINGYCNSSGNYVSNKPFSVSGFESNGYSCGAIPINFDPLNEKSFTFTINMNAWKNNTFFVVDGLPINMIPEEPPIPTPSPAPNYEVSILPQEWIILDELEG